jgi:hypothetical protein
VLEKPGSRCFLLVGARETRELVLPSSDILGDTLGDILAKYGASLRE